MMGLTPEPISTQVIPRDRHAMFFATLGVIASVDRERRHRDPPHAAHRGAGGRGVLLARPEGLARAMPHKRNPVLTENLTGLARLVAHVGDPGAGERGALARTRHLAFLGRARDRPGRDDHARLRAAPAGRRDRQAGRSTPRTCWRNMNKFRGLVHVPARAARADPGRRQPRGRLPPRPAQRDEGLGTGRRLPDRTAGRPGGDAPPCPRPRSTKSSTLGYHTKHVDTIFARVFGEN